MKTLKTNLHLGIARQLSLFLDFETSTQLLNKKGYVRGFAYQDEAERGWKESKGFGQEF